MTDTDRIRTFIDRSIKALTLRPARGLHTAVSKVRVVDGLACEIEEGRWKLTADLSEKSAGSGKGPDPGVFARAALGSCLAMGYVMWGAYRGVPLASVEVEVEADFDAGAQYGLGDSPPGYSEVRYSVSIESPAPEAHVMRIVEEAEANSPYFDVFTREQRLVRSVRLSSAKED
jgi:uncharacterized OsmC-like protein